MRNSAGVFLDAAVAPAYTKPIKQTAASLSTFPEWFFLKINYPASASASNCQIKYLGGEASTRAFANGDPSAGCAGSEIDPDSPAPPGTGHTIIINDREDSPSRGDGVYNPMFNRIGSRAPHRNPKSGAHVDGRSNEPSEASVTRSRSLSCDVGFESRSAGPQSLCLQPVSQRSHSDAWRGRGGRKTPRARWPGCRAGDSSETVPSVAGLSGFSSEPERPDSEATAPTF